MSADELAAQAERIFHTLPQGFTFERAHYQGRPVCSQKIGDTSTIFVYTGATSVVLGNVAYDRSSRKWQAWRSEQGGIRVNMFPTEHGSREAAIGALVDNVNVNRKIRAKTEKG
jgi:hypothetical protein